MQKATLAFVFLGGIFLGSVYEANWGTGASDHKPPAPQTASSDAPPSSGDPAPQLTYPRTTEVSKEAANWVARILFSETKNMEDFEYMAWVVRNRMESPNYPSTAADVALQPDQFSAFNEWSERRRLESMSFSETKITEFRRAYRTAQYVLSAPSWLNPLPEVRHFYAPEAMRKLYNERGPNWAANGTLVWETEQTRYYADVKPPPMSNRSSRSSR